MKKTKFKFSIVFLLLSIFNGYSQQEISGYIFNNNNEPIIKANIQILSIDTLNVYKYDFSDNNGHYEIKISTDNEFILKITAHGYLDYYQEFKSPISKKNTNNIFLDKITGLEEVIIISHQKSARLEGDNIVYNLKAVRDSTEQNLGDLIKKLPGLELTEDGVVKFQGVAIDKILIEGNDFFGSKQQMATENISAEMVDGIDLLLKHQENVYLKEFSENSKIALNIKLNDKSKNRILGNIEGSLGVAEKFYLHSNLFNFFKNGNISFISDLNNIGEMPLTVADYVEIIGGLNSSSSVGITNINNLIPEYIYNENRVESKKNFFSALNLVYKKDRIKLSSNIIFNGFNQRDLRQNEIFYFNSNIQNITESYSEDSKNRLFSTIFKFNYILNSNSDINYTFNYSPVRGSGFLAIKNPNIYRTSKNDRSETITNEIDYVYKFGKDLLMTSNLLFEKNSLKQNLDIKTDIGNNLFRFDSNFLLQNFNYSFEDISGGVFLIHKKNKNKYKFGVSFFKKDETLNSFLLNSNFKNENARTTKVISSSLDVKQYIFNSLFVNYKFSTVSYSVGDEIKNDVKFENNLNLNYEFNKANNVSLGISNSYSLPKLNQQLKTFYVSDYQNINIFPNLEVQEFINLKSFTLNFSNFYQKYEQFFTLNLTYSFSEKNFTTNSYFLDNYNYYNYVIGGGYKKISGLILFDRNFAKIPLVFKSSFSYNYTNSHTFLKDEKNINTSSNILLNLKLISNFKRSMIQFQLTYDFKNYYYKQSLFDDSFTTNIQNFNTRLISKLGQFRLESDISYLTQRNDRGYDERLIVSPGIWYYNREKVWEISIQTDNIFHLNKFSNRTQMSNEIFVANSVQAVLPGYILFGVKYNL